jgi:hypothetical protein
MPPKIHKIGGPITAKIGGVPLASSGYQWPLAAGPVSPRVTIEVDNEVDKELAKLKNPVTYELRATVNAVESGGVMKGLFLGMRKPIDPWHVQWELYDQRRLWEDIRITAFFNVPRKINDKDLGSANGPLQDFDLIAKFRYVSTTLRHPGARTKFQGLEFGSKGEILNKGRVWTALEAIEWLLNGEAVKGRGLPQITYDIRATENDYYLNNLVFVEERFPVILGTLMGLARVDLEVHDGTWYVYDRDEVPIDVPVGNYDGGGFVALSERKRTVPETFVMRVPKKYEIRLDAIEPPPTRARNSTAILTELTSVIAIPDPIVIDGRRREVGEWVEAADVYKAWNDQGWPTGKRISGKQIRKGFFSNRLVEDLCSTPGQAPGYDPQAVGRVAAAKKAFRRSWRIHPALIQSIKSMEGVRVAVTDPVTLHRQPSPVWQDHTLIPTGKPKAGKGQTASKVGSQEIRHPNTPSSSGSGNLLDAQASRFTLTIDDQALGIIHTDPTPMDLDGTLMRVLRSAIKEPIKGFATAVATNNEALLGISECTQDWRMSVIVTVTPLTPNSSEALYSISADAASLGLKTDGSIPALEFPFLAEQARFEWNEGTSVGLNKDGLLEFLGYGEPVNKFTLHAIAQGEIVRAAYGYYDRVSGDFSHPGWDPDKDRLRGNCQSVEVMLSADGTLETHYHIPEAQDVPHLKDLLPYEAKRLLYKDLMDGKGDPL